MFIVYANVANCLQVTSAAVSNAVLETEILSSVFEY